MRRTLLLASLLALLCSVGCPSGGRRLDDDDDDLTNANDDDDDSTSDDDDTADDDDATTPPPPETACEDALDNDGDGLTDCDDDDCAAVWRCTWPTELDHNGSFAYAASWQAELGGYEDCDTVFTAALDEELDPSKQCATCDRTFSGPMVYTMDTCPPGDDPRPDAVSYGLDFVTTTQREVFSSDGLGGWNSVGLANAAAVGSPFSLSRTDGFEVEGVDAGDITTTLSFTDPL